MFVFGILPLTSSSISHAHEHAHYRIQSSFPNIYSHVFTFLQYAVQLKINWKIILTKKTKNRQHWYRRGKKFSFFGTIFFFPTLTTWTSHYYSLFFLRSSSADYEAIITTELWILFLSSSIKRQSLQSTGIFSYINKFLFEVHIFIHAFQWDPSLFYHIHRSFKTCTHLHKSNRHTTNIMHNIFFPKILCILEPY